MHALERLRSLRLRLRAAGRLFSHIGELLPGAHASAATLLQRNAREHGDALALLFEDERYTWAEVNRRANRWARLLAAEGVARRDVVALVMDNRPEFVFALLGASKLQAVVACVNTNVSGPPLAHAIGITRARLVIAGSEHEDAVERVLGEARRFGPPPRMLVHADRDVPPGPGAVNARVEQMPSDDLRGPPPMPADPMTYIYTSGTTGLPKAAIVTNRRFLVASIGFGRVAQAAKPGDVIYVALPLYHGSAQWGGVGAALATGAALALRRRFSASAFWKDAIRFRATRIVYIGELCRYLLNQPPSPDDTAHSVRVAVGNGLRPDIWEPFQTRFAIPEILEFYGATEGNAPILNIEGRRGMLGRLGRRQALVACDVATGEVRRDARGRCERIHRPGETGLYIGKIGGTLKYDGYVDQTATRAKILHDVFRRGDAWFNSGDLMTLHEDRWVSFADRVGDTFRWKGENVSTSEVALALNRGRGVLESSVFGVSIPGTEGRAGMACLVVAPEFDIEAFAGHVGTELPRYSRPLFVRLLGNMRVTSTLKHQKADYQSEGYDPDRTQDSIFALLDDRYVRVTPELFRKIHEGVVIPG
ncbi:MAG TPA: long-chain-acyl-CoA synthetase [Polyangiaceae bacterium]|nr:long-chain-acyl-CoA synthetase [Polyangiaceae bacterium]